MASIISAGTTSGTALNMTADTSGQLQLATNSGTTAVTIDTSQNVGIGTTTPSSYGILSTVGNVANQASALGVADASTLSVVNGLSTALNQKASLVLQSNGYSKSVISGYYANYNGAADTASGLIFGTQTNAAGGVVERMRIDSSGNLLVGTTTTSASKLTVNGNIAPIGSPNAFWGLDYATTSSVGNYVTIANSGTYNFVSGSGATFVYEDSGTVGAVMFMSVYGITYTVWQSGTGYSNVIGTASKVNFGYNSGAGAYYLQNLSGASRNFYISNIRMRQGS